MTASEQGLIERLRQIDAELEEVLDRGEEVDGHKLHEWSAHIRRHADAIWPADAVRDESVPVWGLNLPYVAGALILVAKSLQDIEDARMIEDDASEVAARDRVFIFGQCAKAGAWCMRRLLVGEATADAAS